MSGPKGVHLVLRAYIRYFYTKVKRLSRTFRYYPAVNPKNSVRPVLLSICSCTIHRVQRTICQRTSSGSLLSVLQTVVYIR
jgi:hypothetical protein